MPLQHSVHALVEHAPRHRTFAAPSHDATANTSTDAVPHGVVVKRAVLADTTGYQATAYRVDATGTRHPVVSVTGHPLVAFGSTPLKATAYLLAAVRRTYEKQRRARAATS